MQKMLGLIAVGISVFLCQAATAATWYVDAFVSSPGHGTTWDTAFKTIQEGIDVSSDGDTVIVAEGTYVENIRFNGKNITLSSTNPLDSTVVANTIIDGNQSGSVVTFSGTEDETCALSGFTIRNGKAGEGGGIHGGTWKNSTQATIEKNRICGNLANYGGGLVYCNGLIQNNVIYGNSADASGGGLMACRGNVLNNTIVGNSAKEGGGGLYRFVGPPRNCIVWGNTAAYATQLYESGGMPSYSCIEGWRDDGEGNISSCPYFVNAANGDFHLRSWSPCIDAGHADASFSQEPEPNGGRVNMGAYGNTPDAASKSPDTDSDGLPDDWEMEFFGELAQEPGNDPDEDALSNEQEYQLGSDPTVLGAWRVDGSVTASGDGTTWETAFKRIQEGINAASHGDTVLVAPGIYLENIHFHGKNIRLMSVGPLDPGIVANTIIDGNQSGSVVTLAGCETELCVLSGFTIQNGDARSGGGIYGGVPHYHTHATIENNIISGNSAERVGGGLSSCLGVIQNNTITHNSCDLWGGGIASCDGEIRDNRICLNSADQGGGIDHCDGVIHGNAVVENMAVRHGGGFYECWGTIQKNTIIGNRAGWCGGGLSNCSRAAIENNIIAGNTADGQGGGLSGGGVIRNNTITGNSADLGGGLAYCRGTIRNCIIWRNVDNYGYQLAWSADPLHSCIEGWIGGGEGNIAQDPLFIDPDGPDNDTDTYEDNDYHLSSSSPCIDVGTAEDAPDHDIDGENRPHGAGADMGADEFADTDEDGLPDYWERKYFGDLSDNGVTDSDSDGLTNAQELLLSTNPHEKDTDGDGFSDGDEAVSGTDPNDPSSAPPQADVYVNAVTGDDANDGKTPLKAKNTIQAGIDSSQDGGTVVVTEGTYIENIHFNGRNIILRSMNPCDPTVVARTIIDGNRAGSVVTFAGTEDETCILTGFTIRNGDADYGGGVYGWKSPNYTHATIRDNVITGNSADNGGGVCGCAGEIRENVISANNAALDGGGLYACGGIIENNVISANSAGGGGGLYSCSGVVRGNIITGNWAGNGGGLASCRGLIEGNTIADNYASRGGGGLAYCRGTIRGNVIRGNSAWTSGGGLSMCGGVIQNNVIIDNHVYHTGIGGGGLASCSGIENNLIAGNSAPSGGGLYWCSGSIQNNTIVGNTAFSGSGAAIYDREARSTIRNCIIWGNTSADGTQLYDAQTPSYSCIQDWAGGGDANIADDPRFVDPDGPDDDPETYEDNDYHLSADSPCIDGGVNYLWFTWPQQDLDGNCRLVGDRVDMGCYEYGSSRDSDGDLLSDAQEVALGTDSDREDTDGDDLLDGIEVLRGTDPLVTTPPGILHVPADFGTIQAALFLCGDGDQVVVAPGTYLENIILYGPDVILRSSDPEDPDVVASTILDGRGLGPVVSFSGSEAEACVLAGLTIQNGKGGIEGRGTHATIQQNTITNNSSDSGGGIGGCDGPIRYNTITGNTAEWGGGISGCNGVIENNLISENAAVAGPSGGGVGGGLRGCDGVIQNNIITHNVADKSGGGLDYCDATIQNNIIAANSAGEEGGGLYQCGSDTIHVPRRLPEPPYPLAIIRNNLIIANTAREGGGVADCRGAVEGNTIVGNSAEKGGGISDCWTIRNCIIWGNTAAESAGLYDSPPPMYSCIQDWTEGGEGNIADDPQFVDPDGLDDDPDTYEDNDYRLLPDSPCIDKGKNEDWMWQAVDLDGNPRIWNGTVDMGAYEYGSFPFNITGVVRDSGGKAQLTWNSRHGDSYTIWSCIDILLGDWIEGPTIPSEGETTTWTDPHATDSQKFYRIEIK